MPIRNAVRGPKSVHHKPNRMDAGSAQLHGGVEDSEGAAARPFSRQVGDECALGPLGRQAKKRAQKPNRTQTWSGADAKAKPA